jgi:hypothetical protein
MYELSDLSVRRVMFPLASMSADVSLLSMSQLKDRLEAGGWRERPVVLSCFL